MIRHGGAIHRAMAEAGRTRTLVSWGKPMTAASATLWCATSADSISAEPRRCPDTLSTSARARVMVSSWVGEL